MKPQYRFTLIDPLIGTTVISEPIGWEKIEFNLERHPEYRSVVENFEVPLIFYGSDGIRNGGYDFVKEAIENGVNGGPAQTEQASILIEIKPNVDDAYETLFEGLLKLPDYVDNESKKMIQVPVIRNDLWAKFINRTSLFVDLKGTVDVDGGTVPARNETTLQLPTQTIKQTYRGDHFDNVEYPTTTVGGMIYGIIDFEKEGLNEIAEKFTYSRVATTQRPFELFAMKFGGSYSFECELTLTDGLATWDFPTTSEVYFQINDNARVAFSRADLGTPGVDGRTHFTYSATHTLSKLDFIRIYIESADPCAWPGSADVNFLEVIGETGTGADDSTTPAFLLFDAGLSIIEKILGQPESFYSEYFGGQGTALPYVSDGCGYPHVIAKGLHVRGWSLADKPFQMSFQDWWDGCHNIFGLGLGYEHLDSSPDKEVIRVEKLESFYDDSSNSITLEDVEGIEFSFDNDVVHKSIEVGYAKWEAESASGIDDPQTVHSYNSRMRVTGSDLKLLSRFYAASLGIEQTRRQSEEKTKDWRLDEDIMIIHADMTATPEQPFLWPDPITNLNNFETRYNVKLTPSQNFQRWQHYLGITGAETNDVGFTFAKGEGNVTMSVTGSGDDCDGISNAWIENSDLTNILPKIHRAKLANFTHPLTFTQYKAVRANRKKSIAVRYWDNAGVQQEATCFIKKLKYSINISKASFELWIRDIVPV